MRLFVIFQVSIRDLGDHGLGAEPVFQQVHHFTQGTGNGHGMSQTKEWAAEHARPDTLYCTAEVWNSAEERRWRAIHSFSVTYWSTSMAVEEGVLPSTFGAPFYAPPDESPQAEEEGREA